MVFSVSYLKSLVSLFINHKWPLYCSRARGWTLPVSSCVGNVRGSYWRALLNKRACQREGNIPECCWTAVFIWIQKQQTKTNDREERGGRRTCWVCVITSTQSRLEVLSVATAGLQWDPREHVAFLVSFITFLGHFNLQLFYFMLKHFEKRHNLDIENSCLLKTHH